MDIYFNKSSERIFLEMIFCCSLKEKAIKIQCFDFLAFLTYYTWQFALLNIETCALDLII